MFYTISILELIMQYAYTAHEAYFSLRYELL